MFFYPVSVVTGCSSWFQHRVRLLSTTRFRAIPTLYWSKLGDYQDNHSLSI